MKICTKCNKPGEFYTGKDICKICHIQVSKQRYREDVERKEQAKKKEQSDSEMWNEILTKAW